MQDYYCSDCGVWVDGATCPICGRPADSLNVKDSDYEMYDEDQKYPEDLVDKFDKGDADIAEDVEPDLKDIKEEEQEEVEI